MWSQQRIQPWHRAAVAWAEGLKAPVLSIDPPPELPALNPRQGQEEGAGFEYFLEKSFKINEFVGGNYKG